MGRVPGHRARVPRPVSLPRRRRLRRRQPCRGRPRLRVVPARVRAVADRGEGARRLAGSGSGRAGVVDGGLLDNAPISAALDLIPMQPASRQVRRYACYVNADPPVESPPAADEDRPRQPTTTTILGDVFGLPRRAPSWTSSTPSRTLVIARRSPTIPSRRSWALGRITFRPSRRRSSRATRRDECSSRSRICWPSPRSRCCSSGSWRRTARCSLGARATGESRRGSVAVGHSHGRARAASAARSDPRRRRRRLDGPAPGAVCGAGRDRRTARGPGRVAKRAAR